MPGVFQSHGRYYRLVRQGARKTWVPLTRVDDGLPALHRALAALLEQRVEAPDSVPALVRRWQT